MTGGPATDTSRRIPIVAVRRDGGTQVRESMNPTTVQDYKDALLNGDEFPPVTVFHDGEVYWLADGFHRLLAHEAAGLVDILAEIHEGTKRDALLFAVGANASHGLQRTNKDKRRAVEILLRDEEWASKSDRQIAEKAAVTHPTVAKVRAELTGKDFQSTERTGKDGRVINTANIGKVKPQPAEETPPAPVTRSPGQLAEEKIRAATTRQELDAAYQEASNAGLSDCECEAVAEARQKRGAELRAQATPKADTLAPTAAPPPTEKQGNLFTEQSVPMCPQAAPSQPKEAATVVVDAAEWEAMCKWRESIAARAGAADEASVSKVMRLIALASSPNEHEAASAALKACRMIRERGLLVAATMPDARCQPATSEELEAMRRKNEALWEEMRKDVRDIANARRAS